MYTSYQYTKNVEFLFRDAISKANTFYCREDFDDAIQLCKEAPEDSIAFEREELDGMCEACGLDASTLLQDPRALDAIPTRSQLLDQLQDRFVETFYNLRNNAPSAHDYIKRLVRRLAPEYAEDTVRVAILKKYVLGAGTDCREYDTSSVIRWAVLRMSEEERKAYATAEEQTQLEMVLQKLDDSIFCKEHMTSELGWDDIIPLILRREKRLSETEVITAAGNTIAYPPCKLEAKVLHKEAPTVCRFLALAEAEQYSVLDMIQTLMEKLEEQEDATDKKVTPPSDRELSDFVKFLEKSFKKHLNSFTYRTRTGSTGKLGQQYGDDVDYAKRQRQDGNWDILIKCNDLAQGAFKTNNRKTRVNLYHFAMMFDMTFTKKREDMDPDTDIRKNLFEDYYCDNLVRYLGRSPLNLQESSGWEKEPPGEGINWKNYAEAIYLYYLHQKDSQLTAGQKINLAEEKIAECKSSANPEKTKSSPREYTQYYTNVFFDVILEAKEEDLCKCILDYYPIHGDGVTPIQKASHQITATEFFEESLEYMEQNREAEYEPDDFDQYLQDRIDEMVATTSTAFDWGLAPLLKGRYGDDTDFVRLVDNLHSRLTEEYDWVGGRKKTMLIWVLQALYHHSSRWNPIGMERLGKIVERRDSESNGTAITNAVQTLQKLGFDVHQLSGNDESVLFWNSLAPLLSVYHTYRHVVRVEAMQEWMEKLVQEENGKVRKENKKRTDILLRQLEAKHAITMESASGDRLICWNEPNAQNILDVLPMEQALGYAIVKNAFDVMCAIDAHQKEDHMEEPELRETFRSTLSGDFHFIKQKDLIDQVCRMMPDADKCYVSTGIDYMLECKIISNRVSNHTRYLCWSVPIASRQDEVLKRLRRDEATFRDVFLQGLQQAEEHLLKLTDRKNEKIVNALVQYESSHNVITLTALWQKLRKTDRRIDRDRIVAGINRLKMLGKPVSVDGSYETLISRTTDWDENSILEDLSKEQDAELSTLEGVIGFLSDFPKEHRTITGRLDQLVAVTQSRLSESVPARVLRAVDYLASAGIQIRVEDGAFIWERAYYDKSIFHSVCGAFMETLATEKDFIENLLIAMSACNSGQCAIRMCELKKLLAGNKKLGSSKDLLNAVKQLTGLKAGIRKLGSGDSLFYLGAREYAQEKMNSILKKVETRYEPDLVGLRKLFSELLAEVERYKRKVTRTTILSLYLIYYVERLPETKKVYSFPALYDDFVSCANEILLDCRYQPLHEKNILDMYVLLSLFFHVTRKGRK